MRTLAMAAPLGGEICCRQCSGRGGGKEGGRRGRERFHFFLRILLRGPLNCQRQRRAPAARRVARSLPPTSTPRSALGARTMHGSSATLTRLGLPALLTLWFAATVGAAL